MAKFRLEPVLKLRQHREDARKRELAEAVAAEVRQKDAVVRLAGLRQEQAGSLRSDQRVGPLDMETLIERRRYVGLLDREIHLRLGEVAQAEHATAGCRRKMVEAMKDRKALEVLRQRAVQAANRKEASVEMAALDETALRGHRLGRSNQS